MVKLGSLVKDTITGFEGIAVGRADYLFGCSRIAIQSATLKDGKPIDQEWVDEQRVEVLAEMPVMVSKDSSAMSGGPQADPAGRPDPV